MTDWRPLLYELRMSLPLENYHNCKIRWVQKLDDGELLFQCLNDKNKLFYLTSEKDKSKLVIFLK